ncbi:nucleotidyltransferase [Aequorivita sp. H23M31]|uniref:Nucleotidyltransferase n=1 Tax=Aequorivita ciconiae TaxID=2494375 RepID=A0A410FZW6_9FLAO|nr:nucleotidyltransferase [Aequorivita sp. H23M31]QAA80556.1 nucleotidyltransferase [Aequorivita sp. H23M31]
MSNQILLQIAQYLDISPTDFKIAQERFNAVKNWIENGVYKSGYSPYVYLQGSFRLGTVVRPYHKDRDGNFDIDQVCELTKYSESKSSEILKNDIGNRLKENIDYKRMLDVEGKRCWTLNYASENNRPGFHIDILPALKADEGSIHNIEITHKENKIYTWSTSNPQGYYLWFKSKNAYSSDFIESQRSTIFNANKELYERQENVPKQLFRTSLQRAIQIMKRHRDVHFVYKDFKPISIIITTLATQVHTRNNIIEIIKEFIDYVLSRNEFLIKNGYLSKDDILDYSNCKWSIHNPVDYSRPESEKENFADRWNLEPELANSFFEWVQQLKRDLKSFEKSGLSDNLNLKTKSFGTGDRIDKILIEETEKILENGVGLFSSNNRELLDLIHLGIEGKTEWEPIIELAKSYYSKADEGESKDIAKVNYYQIFRHKGHIFSQEARNDIEDVLRRNKDSSSFVLCCNLLLGSATQDMIKNCMAEFNYENILEWPILRLHKLPFLL